MGSTLEVYHIPQADKGLRGKESDSRVPDGFAITGTQNVRFLRGEVTKRPGLYNGGAGGTGASLQGRVQKFFDYYTVARVQYPICITTTKIYALSIGSNTWTDITGAAKPSPGSVDILPQVTVFNGSLIHVDGVNPPAEWAGSGTFTALTGSAPQTARFVMGFASHLILGSPTLSGGVVKPTRLMWSDFNNENQWASGDAGFFEFSDTNDQFMGLVQYGDYGVLLRRYTIWLITPTDAPVFYVFDKRVDAAGCIAPGSVAVLPTGVMYLGDDGMFYLFNGVAAQAIGEGVWPLFRGGLSYTLLGRAVSVVDPLNGLYYCWVPFGAGVTDNSAAFVFNYFEGTFSYDTTAVTGAGLIANVGNITWNQLTGPWNSYGISWSSGEFAAGQPLVYVSTGSDVNYLQNQLNDQSTAGIPSVYVAPLRDLKYPDVYKRVEKVVIYYRRQGAGTLSVQLGSTNFDDVSTVTYSPAQSIDQTQAGKCVAYFDVPPAVFFTVRVSNSALNQGFSVIGIEYHFRKRGKVLGAP